MMMTDQIPLDLAPPPLLNGEVPLMPHMVNGDAAQQVILVQVNPGETFTIRAEDGSLQCIQDATCLVVSAAMHSGRGHFLYAMTPATPVLLTWFGLPAPGKIEFAVGTSPLRGNMGCPSRRYVALFWSRPSTRSRSADCAPPLGGGEPERDLGWVEVWAITLAKC
eukprot:superscaffoldBa00001302_g9988